MRKDFLPMAVAFGGLGIPVILIAVFAPLSTPQRLTLLAGGIVFLAAGALIAAIRR